MHPDTDTPRTFVLPLGPLFLLTAGALALAWLLMPTEEQMTERVLKDRHFEQVIACLSAMGHVDAARAVELRRMSGRRLASLAQLFSLTPREQLRSVFSRGRLQEYDLLAHGLVLRAMQFVDVIPPQEAFDIVRPQLDRIPGGYRVDLLELLGRNAHAVDQPALAVECYRLASQTPEAHWPTLKRMAQTFRWENRSREASEILRRWLLKHEPGLGESERAEAHALQYVMSLEAGQPTVAFDRCLTELESLPAGTAPPRDMLERAVQAAIFSGRGGEVLPWMERFVNAMPKSDTTWNHLPKLSAAEPQHSAELRKWWSQMARLADWSCKPEMAFGWHLRAAALGDVDSLDRCLALHAWLGRTAECAELLQVLGPVPGREELGAMLPRMIALLGREKEACELFRHWLERHPEDGSTRYALACLLEDLGDDADSMKQLELVLLQKPDDAAALQKLSTAQMRQKFFHKALSILESAPDTAHNDDTLEGYAALAESLDRHDARLHALQLTLKHKAEPEPRDYQQLADAAGYTAHPEQALDILAEGVRRFPDDTSLRLALAGLHAQRQDYAAALALAMHPPLRDRFEIVVFILALAPHVGDARKVLDFIGRDVEHCHALAVPDRLQLAVLHHKAGHTADSSRLFASVPETPEHVRVIAQARFHCEDFAAAERLMLGCVKDTRHATTNDWVFLGDIYERQGRPDDAQRAYDYSLALLSADLPDTASR